MNNEIKISVPDGMEIDRENSTFELIKFKPIEKKQTAKEWLEKFMEQEFTLKTVNGNKTLFLRKQWIYQLDLKSKTLWYNYDKIGRIISDEFKLDDKQISTLQTEVAGKILNCDGLTGEWLGQTSEILF